MSELKVKRPSEFSEIANGEAYRKEFRMIAPIKDVHYGLGLLQSDIMKAFIFSTAQIAQHIERTAPVSSDKKRLDWRRANLRMIRLGDGFEPLDIVVGLCARKGERELYERLETNHPLAVLWRIFSDYEQRLKSYE